jgi:hypothetical protein
LQECLAVLDVPEAMRLVDTLRVMPVVRVRGSRYRPIELPTVPKSLQRGLPATVRGPQVIITLAAVDVEQKDEVDEMLQRVEL